MSSEIAGIGAARIGTVAAGHGARRRVGLLAAPQTGTETRRALRKRLAAAREGLEGELRGSEERSRPARRAVRARAEELRAAGARGTRRRSRS